MAEGALVPLTRAVEARRRGETPSAADLAACKRQRWKAKDLRCWNGKRIDRQDCNWVGSQNIPIWAAAGLGDWVWIAAVCRVEKEEGNFGRENGSPGAFYYSGPLSCKLLAQKELLHADREDDAEACRLAVRSNLAWDTLTALPVPRLRDEVNEAGVIRKAINPKVSRRLTVAVSGMRWSTKGRAALTSEDAHSLALANELASPDGLGLTAHEMETVRRAIAGDVGAAREVSRWCFGTIETPEMRWRWRLRRTTLGAESLYLGDWPNGMKPMRVVTQIFNDGTWKGMRPSPEKKVSKWADGFEVHIEDGIIHSRCVAGEASLPELGGRIIWQVDVEGSRVSFQAGMEKAA